MVSIASLVEASIEFPEEGHEFTQREECLQSLDRACSDLERLLSHADLGQQIRDGFGVVLIGRRMLENHRC